jgi:hypothetical protein
VESIWGYGTPAQGFSALLSNGGDRREIAAKSVLDRPLRAAEVIRHAVMLTSTSTVDESR